MPPVDPRGLWPAQLQAVRNLERSLAAARPRALVQMATGSGKTFTAVSSIYRLVKFGGAHRVLFLVDRANLGKQALKEFQSFRTSDAERAAARAALLRAAAAPLAGNPPLRQQLVDLKRAKEQTIDRVSVDALLSAGLSAEARERAAALTTSFEAFCLAHRDETVALRLLYGSGRDRRLTRGAVEELAAQLAAHKPPLAPLEDEPASALLARIRAERAGSAQLRPPECRPARAPGVQRAQ